MIHWPQTLLLILQVAYQVLTLGAHHSHSCTDWLSCISVGCGSIHRDIGYDIHHQAPYNCITVWHMMLHHTHQGCILIYQCLKHWSVGMEHNAYYCTIVCVILPCSHSMAYGCVCVCVREHEVSVQVWAGGCAIISYC